MSEFLDLTNLTEDDLSGKRVPPGKYHAVITSSADDNGSTSPARAIKLLLLTGEAKGMTLTEKLFLTDKSKKRFALVLRRLGVIKPEDFGKRVEFDWNSLVGRQCIVEVTEEEFDKRDGTKGKTSKLAYAGVWPLDHPDVASVPRDTEYAKRATASPPAAAEDDFGDI